MRARLSRLRVRDVALFVAVAAVVAVVGVFVAREAGVGGREAVAEGETLTLTLSAPEICETKQARNLVSSLLRTNAAGARVREWVSHGWRVFAETPVTWRVSGGTAPYTLVIDGESRDADGDYLGAVGAAMVSCAITTLGTYFEVVSRQVGVTRLYREDPQVDSGAKTIRAVVMDAAGRTAEATVDFYVLYSIGHHDDLLRGGEAYRVFGHLITIPDGVDMRIGDAITGSSGHGVQGFYIEGTDPFVVIWLDARTFREVKREVPSEEGTGATGRSGYTESELREYHSTFDAFASSVDQPPNLERGDQ